MNKMSSLKNHKSILLTTIICLVSTVLFAQDYNDYLLMAKQRLSEGNCEKAQENYRVYKELTGQANDKLEKQIAKCFCDKVTETDIPVKPNTPPLYVTDFSVSQNGKTLRESEVRKLFANTKSYDLYDKGLRLKNGGETGAGVCGLVGALTLWCQLGWLGYEGNGDWSSEIGKNFVIYGSVATGACIVGAIVGGIVKSSGKSYIRKAVNLYNNGDIYTQNSIESEYGLTGNDVYFTLQF